MTHHDHKTDTSRRRFLGALGGTAMLTLWPGLSIAASDGHTRMVVVLQRGAMDGLHLLPPRDDADYLRARGALAVRDALALDGSFGLHPKMTFAHRLYADKQLLPLVAVAPPYQQRSHFDAQNCLENGTAGPGGARDGWIGRCIQSMATAEGVAIAQVMPLAMRGSLRAEIWSPPLPRDLPDTLIQQLQPLYAADARLASIFADAMQAQATGMGDRRGAFRLPDPMSAAAQRMRGPDAVRVGGEWPGLSAGALLEGRDLRPTTDMRALFKGLLAAHLAVPETALETRIFPDSRAVKPLEGLLA